jgi:hypothetical protein
MLFRVITLALGLLLGGGGLAIIVLAFKYRGTRRVRAFAVFHGMLIMVVGTLVSGGSLAHGETPGRLFVAGGATLVADALLRWGVVPRLEQDA